jgi:hypothetical protein
MQSAIFYYKDRKGPKTITSYVFATLGVALWMLSQCSFR